MLLCHSQGEKISCFLFPLLLLIETQIVAEETARRLISVLCNDAAGRRRPRNERGEQRPAAPDIKAIISARSAVPSRPHR